MLQKAKLGHEEKAPASLPEPFSLAGVGYGPAVGSQWLTGRKPPRGMTRAELSRGHSDLQAQDANEFFFQALQFQLPGMFFLGSVVECIF